MKTRRLTSLTIAIGLCAALFWVPMHRAPDTATAQIVGHALSSPAGTDSTYYMQMGEDAFREPGHRIYQKLFFTEHQKFIYPPSSLLLTEALDGMARFGVPAQGALGALLVAGWAGLLALAVLLYRVLRRGSTLVEAACIVLIGVLFLPIAEGLYRGQVQVLLTALWGLAAVLWCTRRHGWAGVALAISCAFKPQMALFALWGVWRKEWRFSGALIGVVAAIELCSVAHFGLRNNLDYFAVLSFLSRHGEALWANQSVNGLMQRVLNNGQPAGWDPVVYPPYRASIYLVSTAFAAVAVLVGLILPGRRGWQATPADFLFFGCVATVASPIVWEHHYSIFFFAAVYLMARSETLSRVQWSVFVACMLAMANRLPKLDHQQHGIRSLVGDYLLYAGLALLVLLAASAEKKDGLREAELRS